MSGSETPWIEWKPKEGRFAEVKPPVGPSVSVDWRLRDGTEYLGAEEPDMPAGSLDWRHSGDENDIIAYRVVRS